MGKNIGSVSIKVDARMKVDSTAPLPGGTWRERYERYLRSPEWETRRKRALDRAERRCQLCNSAKNLQVHHRTYERLGCELPADLTVLCKSCHMAFEYRKRAQRNGGGQRKRSRAPKRGQREHVDLDAEFDARMQRE